MLNRNLALVADTNEITPSQLTKVAAALQKQATRDFAPLWDIQANVSGFAKLEDVPTDYWPVIVRNDIKTPGAAGVHEDKNGQPFALVQFSDDWSLTATSARARRTTFCSPRWRDTSQSLRPTTFCPCISSSWTARTP